MKKKQPVHNPRQTAFKVTMATLHENQDVQAALNTALEKNAGEEQEKKLITELVYGYLRYKGRIDFLLGLFLKQPQKLPPGLFILLGLAAYEILFLRIPHHASVSEAVKQTKRFFGPKLAHLTNAVLRRVCDLPARGEKKELYIQDSPEETVFFSRYFSCPLWIVKYLGCNFSAPQVEMFLSAFLQQPPTGIRIHAQKCPQHDPQAFATLASQIQAEEQGLVSRQSLAVQGTINHLEPRSWPQPIWDACAGRGGKSFFLAEQQMQVLASDRNKKRLYGLKAEQQRLGLYFPVFLADAGMPCLKNAPATILLDVPCSGLGVLSCRPDTKWKRKKTDLAGLQAIQSRLLQASANLLPKGGNLIYMTCTLGREENSGQIEALLRQKPFLRLADEYQTPPTSDLYEFFYAARLHRM